MFTTRDPVHHKNLKRPVAQLFSMTNMKNYEPYADECTSVFLAAMRDMQGQAIDLSAWCQWYAFDVIACITFQRRFGFMEQRRDVNNMIGDLDTALQVVKVAGTYPEIHPWLMGNKKLLDTLKWLGVAIPDPLRHFVKVCQARSPSPSDVLTGLVQFTEDEIARHDVASKVDTGRTDFLAQIRAKDAQTGQISQRDMVNHLSNNLLVS